MKWIFEGRPLVSLVCSYFLPNVINCLVLLPLWATYLDWIFLPTLCLSDILSPQWEKSWTTETCWPRFWNTGSSRSRCQSVCRAAPHWWYLLYVRTQVKGKHAPSQVFACTYTCMYGPACVQEHMWVHMCEGMYPCVCKHVRARSPHCFLGRFAAGLNKSQVD